jgi:serine/threonine-protein kinase
VGIKIVRRLIPQPSPRQGRERTVGRGIADALSARATGQTRPTDPRAVELYLRARAELRRFWGNHVVAAADLLEEAAAISPGSVPIMGALAYASVQAWVMQADPALLDRARAGLERGLALGPPEAILASASFRFNTGDAEGGAADLGTALVRAPMLGQAHETAGRILVEIGEVAAARSHFTTAIALDPTRAHLLDVDLARLDALEGWWERADRTLAAIIADPDRSISELGGLAQSRLAGWRGDRQLLATVAKTFAPRLGPFAGRMVEVVSRAAVTGDIESEMWPAFLHLFGGAGRPHRGQLMGLQLLSEMALVLGKVGPALDALEAADRMGLIDIVVLDRCPLFDRLTDEPRFQAVRGRVAERAARVLAAFRAAAG